MNEFALNIRQQLKDRLKKKIDACSCDVCGDANRFFQINFKKRGAFGETIYSHFYVTRGDVFTWDVSEGSLKTYQNGRVVYLTVYMIEYLIKVGMLVKLADMGDIDSTVLINASSDITRDKCTYNLTIDVAKLKALILKENMNIREMSRLLHIVLTDQMYFSRGILYKLKVKQ